MYESYIVCYKFDVAYLHAVNAAGKVLTLFLSLSLSHSLLSIQGWKQTFQATAQGSTTCNGRWVWILGWHMLLIFSAASDASLGH